MSKYIQINEYSTTPKYKQIVHSILTAIEEGKLTLNDRLPSVNRMMIDFDISRDTIVKAFDYLKQIGIVASIPGKGFFVKSRDIQRSARVFLLFNKLSTHKKIIYDSLAATLGDQASIDFFIYNNDIRLFKNYILSHLDGPYTHFVIISHFLERSEEAARLINLIPSQKLILLDKRVEGITGEYGGVYQEFAEDIYHSLSEAVERLRNYKKLKLIFPSYSYHPQDILLGFRDFCVDYAFEHEWISDVGACTIEVGDVFINLMEDDLVTLIKRAKVEGLQIGTELGIISYNDTPLKEILLNGISVISTDFEKLGKTTGEMILGLRNREQVSNPFYWVMRNSL